ncbi:unnamed protein product [Ilex paraguariensis]|uniref:Uncharacterized protein n=1 Tax=Ilex paraguariensis TaxID=185542 RepID=A0ABC8UIN3_9AQUA
MGEIGGVPFDVKQLSTKYSHAQVGTLEALVLCRSAATSDNGATSHTVSLKKIVSVSLSIIFILVHAPIHSLCSLSLSLSVCATHNIPNNALHALKPTTSLNNSLSLCKQHTITHEHTNSPPPDHHLQPNTINCHHQCTKIQPNSNSNHLPHMEQNQNGNHNIKSKSNTNQNQNHDHRN